MNCKHTISILSGCCVHCGTPDPRLVSEDHVSAFSDTDLHEQAFLAGRRCGKTGMTNDIIEQHLKAGQSVYYMSMTGGRQFDSLDDFHRFNKELADQVVIGGTRRDYAMATIPYVHESPHWDPAWDFTPYTGDPVTVGENPCKDIVLQYVEDFTISPTLREYMQKWRDLIDAEIQDAYFRSFPTSTQRPNRNGVVYPNVTHQLVDVSVVKDPTIDAARLSNADFTSGSDGWDMKKEVSIASKMVISKMIDRNINRLLSPDRFALNKPETFVTKKPMGHVVNVHGNPDTHELFVDIAITPPSVIQRKITVPDGGFSIGVHSANPLLSDRIENLTHWHAEPGYLPIDPLLKRDIEENGPGREVDTIMEGTLGTVDGVTFKMDENRAITDHSLNEVPKHLSLQQWWANSVNSMSSRPSPADAPTLPATGPTTDEYHRLLGELQDKNVPVSKRAFMAAVGLNPHGEMELPREEPKAPSFNQESVDWYTAVADEMLDQCERDGEDQGTTILRVTTALDRQLDTQAKVVRAAYKKVGMFCIDIERNDERVSLVIERKGWWTR